VATTISAFATKDIVETIAPNACAHSAVHGPPHQWVILTTMVIVTILQPTMVLLLLLPVRTWFWTTWLVVFGNCGQLTLFPRKATSIWCALMQDFVMKQLEHACALKDSKVALANALLALAETTATDTERA
jgi:hypothetical protein